MDYTRGLYEVYTNNSDKFEERFELAYEKMEKHSKYKELKNIFRKMETELLKIFTKNEWEEIKGNFYAIEDYRAEYMYLFGMHDYKHRFGIEDSH